MELLDNKSTSKKWGGFLFDTEITKVKKDGQGRTHIIAVASDSMIDLQQDRMSFKALKRMESQLKGEEVALVDSHDATFPFGVSDSAKVNKIGESTWELEIDFVLDDSFPQSAALQKAVELGHPAFQLSIGGSINRENSNAVAIETDKNTGRLFRTINDVILDHVATTRPQRAANPRARFMAAIIKSLNGIEQDRDFYKWHSPDINKTDLSDTVMSIVKKYTNKEDLDKNKAVHTFFDDSNFSEELMSQGTLDNTKEVLKTSDVETVLSTLENMVSKGFTSEQLSGVLGAKMRSIHESFSNLLKSTEDKATSNTDTDQAELILNKETINEIVSQVVSKMSEINENVFDTVAEKMASSKGLENISKSIDTVYRDFKKDLGDNTKSIDGLKERVEVVEKAGGVTNSVPVESTPTGHAIQTTAPTSANGGDGLFKNIWTGAANKALSEIKK